MVAMSADEPGSQSPTDPVVARRHQIERLAKLAQRVGYVLFATAVLAFFVSLVSGSPPVVVSVTTWSLILGCAVLAPAMVAGYMVKAADRADREDDWR